MQAPAPAEADGKADGEAAGGAADATASSGSGDGNGGAQAARACHVCSRIYDPQQQAFVRSTDAVCIELYRQLRTEEAVLLWPGVDGCV